MSDRFSAQIWIGGKVFRTDLEGLIEALHSDGASHDYGDAVIRWEDFRDSPDCIRFYLNDGLLNLKDDQASYGRFDHTESFCIENNIPFDRWSDNYCEYPAETASWRPGMESAIVLLEAIDSYKVREALSKLQSFSHDHLCSYVTEATRLLQEACPPEAPKLEKFEIVA